ncbi:MAG TPA: GNAT family N-acetyltransferase [Aggregatilineales bacterium]|nr:GNAT family N-acetyltransferase [Aggregatilineales bacterium]
MAGLLIRKAASDDTSIIAQYVVAMIREIETLGGYPAADANESLAWLLVRVAERVDNEENLYLIAEFDNRIVGMLEAECTRLAPVFRDRSVVHISSVYVEPDFRRQGIGQALMQAALAWARQRGIEEIELDVLARNPAKRLYEKLGFEVFEHKMIMKL